jgi:U3 small nucleolar RNA-associated protein 14
LLEKEFEDEKTRDVESEEPKEESGELPGWGDWAGDGVKPKKKKEEVKPKRKRRDDLLKHVIINEKAAAFEPKVLVTAPKREGVATLQQYEKAFALPIGKDWNTSRAFKEHTRPDVEIKKGEVIEPITEEEVRDVLVNRKKEKKMQDRRDRSWTTKKPQPRLSKQGLKA